MSYAACLDVIARLHVDARFRNAFLVDPRAALADAGLSAAEEDRLALLDGRALALVGRMAGYHRRTRIQEHLSWADPEVRPGLAGVLAGYFQVQTPPALNREEAIAFCRCLESGGGHDGVDGLADLPPYLPELARSERLRLELAWELAPAPGGGRREAFRYPVGDILAALARAPGWPPAEERGVTLDLIKVPGLPAVLVRPVA